MLKHFLRLALGIPLCCGWHFATLPPLKSAVGLFSRESEAFEVTAVDLFVGTLCLLGGSTACTLVIGVLGNQIISAHENPLWPVVLQNRKGFLNARNPSGRFARRARKPQGFPYIRNPFGLLICHLSHGNGIVRELGGLSYRGEYWMLNGFGCCSGVTELIPLTSPLFPYICVGSLELSVIVRLLWWNVMAPGEALLSV